MRVVILTNCMRLFCLQEAIENMEDLLNVDLALRLTGDFHIIMQYLRCKRTQRRSLAADHDCGLGVPPP